MSTNRDDLVVLATRLSASIPVKDRRFHFRLHKACFVAHEAVEWLVKEKLAKDRAAAVKLGILLQEAGLIHHVKVSHFCPASPLLSVALSAQTLPLGAKFAL